MGKRKGGFNWKARQQNETIIDRSTEKKIKLDPEVISSTEINEADDSNVLVLPSEKRKSKTVGETEKRVKQLSKKERKRLEKVIETKKKKARRAELLESLSKVQASTEELKQFSSIAEVQTGRFKKKLNEKKNESTTINSVAKGRKKVKNVPDESEDESDSDSSVHTSDMSTDDESDHENQTVGQGQEEITTKSQGQTDDSGCETSGEKSDLLEEGSNQESKSKTCTEEKKATTTEDKADDIGEQTRNPVVNIPVDRAPEIQAARLKLPILSEEQVVMETINDNMVTIICGETGSGKTTQVPQFLYEAGFAHNGGIIGVTEPRRVAAISMSQRVAQELNLTDREVSYQIRYEGNVTPDTKIKFLTDGVLLKEVQKDFLLTKYSVVIIDEAHERSVYTDILIGLLSRIVPLRNKQGNPLKMIIMSATLRVEDFTENRRLFKVQPPVVKVDSRQFPVTIHFNRRTPVDDYLAEAFKKICKIHRTLPEGGILVFVTGQQEVHTLCQKLRNTFPVGGKVEPKEKMTRRQKKEKQRAEALPKINLDNYSIDPVDEEAEREGGDSDIDEDLLAEDIEDGVNEEDLQTGSSSEPLYVLPLYSLLSKEKQNKVFSPPPEGCRLCVVATNVAETSLTIPNVRYVIDTGKVKTKFYDKVTGVSTFKITWTSKASANQRAGRAGRVGPGHCYRLYSSAVYNDDFEKFSPAEIMRRPVDDLVLQMKYMNIDRIVNFPFPTPPDDEQVKAAETLLVSLGALTPPVKGVRMKDLKKAPVTKITPLGKVMACFPVSPRYAKMLALGHQHELLVYVVALVAGLSVHEVFVEIHKPADTDKEKEAFRNQIQYMTQVRRLWAGSGHSLLLGDLMVLLKAIGSAEYQGCTYDFCQKHGLRYKAMREVRKLRAQLTNTVNMVIPDANICLNPKLEPPTDIQAKLLRQIILSGLADHVARKFPDPPPDADDDLKKRKNAYQCTELEEPVYLHPTSVLYKQRPEFIVYQYIQETSKLYMKGISAIEPEWLPVYAPSFCNMSKPQEDPSPFYDQSKDQVRCHMSGTFSRCCWEVPSVELQFPANIDRYKWFARFLLEGVVVPKLMKYVPDLLSLPSTMVKSWAKLQPRTEILLKELVGAGVDNKESLLTAWNKNPQYLLRAFCEWLPQSKHIEIEMSWPPIKR